MLELQPPPARLVAPPPAIVDDAPAITAGRYITLRRETVGLSVEQAAAHAVPPSGSKLVVELLRKVEADEFVLDDAQIDQLRSAFVFDPFIYRCLRDGVPAGRICTGCGCSWNDACTTRDGRTCAWVSEKPELCSLCLLDLPRVPRGPRHLVAVEPTISTAILDALRPFAAAAEKIARACPDERPMEFRFTAGQYRAAARAIADAGVR